MALVQFCTNFATFYFKHHCASQNAVQPLNKEKVNLTHLGPIKPKLPSSVNCAFTPTDSCYRPLTRCNVRNVEKCVLCLSMFIFTHGIFFRAPPSSLKMNTSHLSNHEQHVVLNSACSLPSTVIFGCESLTQIHIMVSSVADLVLMVLCVRLSKTWEIVFFYSMPTTY